jgi:hypothetical protein
VALCRRHCGHDFLGHSNFVGGADVFFSFSVFGVPAQKMVFQVV